MSTRSGNYVIENLFEKAGPYPCYTRRIDRQNSCILWIAAIVSSIANGKFLLWQNEYNFAWCFFSENFEFTRISRYNVVMVKTATFPFGTKTVRLLRDDVFPLCQFTCHSPTTPYLFCFKMKWKIVGMFIGEIKAICNWKLFSFIITPLTFTKIITTTKIGNVQKSNSWQHLTETVRFELYFFEVFSLVRVRPTVSIDFTNKNSIQNAVKHQTTEVNNEVKYTTVDIVVDTGGFTCNN